MTTLSLVELVEQLAVQTRGPLANLRDPDGRLEEGQATGSSLLTQLHDVARGAEGSGAGGKSDSGRLLIQARAADTWKDIRDEIAGLYTAAVRDIPASLMVRPTPLLLAWWVTFDAMCNRGELGPEYIQSARDHLEGWKRRILRVIDPPTQVPLHIDCPVCGQRRAVSEGGDESMAVVAEFHRSQGIDGISACCQACREVLAVGRVEVINLGRRAGIDVDVEAVADKIRHAIEYEHTSRSDSG